jgi:hypothetical protein
MNLTLRFPHEFMPGLSSDRMPTTVSFAAYPAIVMFVPSANL